jgi:hypothetical protein
MLRRLCVALATAILMTVALAQGAAADPIASKNSFAFPATCDGQQVEFVVIGGGDFTPAHVVGSTAVFIPEVLDITFEFTPTGGTTMTETFTAAKPHPLGDVTCSFDVTVTDPAGTFRLFGTATGFFTPAS